MASCGDSGQEVECWARVFFGEGQDCSLDHGIYGGCRPGAACGDGKCIACGEGVDQPAACVVAAVIEASVRRKLRLEKERRERAPDNWGNNMVEKRASKAEFFNLRVVVSGTLSVSNGATIVVEKAVASVKAGLQPTGKGASRSGAKFYMTEDHEYLVKGFDRKSEYEQFVGLLDTEVAQTKTTLNVPALVFAAFGRTSDNIRYWTVMPNVDTLFRRYLAADASLVNKFDVKPPPIRSEDRDGCLARLREIGFRPDLDRLGDFNETLRRDVELLTSRRLVDYSWLIYEYTMAASDAEHALIGEATASVPAWCFAGPSSNSSDTGVAGLPTMSVTPVLCFALIDYALVYGEDDTRMRVENALPVVGDGKWDNYNDKFWDLTRDIFAQPLGPRPLGSGP